MATIVNWTEDSSSPWVADGYTVKVYYCKVKSDYLYKACIEGQAAKDTESYGISVIAAITTLMNNL